MSSFLSRGSGPAASALLAQLPQVNLLPPEVRASRSLRSLKRSLALALVAVVVLVGTGFYWSTTQVAAAEDRLADAEAEAATLTAAQAEYASVTPIVSRVTALKDARVMGMSTEVDWAPYLLAIFAVMPENAQLASIELTGSTPMLAVTPSTSPLDAPSVSALSFTGRSATLPDAAGMIDGLNSIPGFSDAWVVTAEVADVEPYGVHYEIAATVHVTADAYTERFVQEEN